MYVYATTSSTIWTNEPVRMNETKFIRICMAFHSDDGWLIFRNNKFIKIITCIFNGYWQFIFALKIFNKLCPSSTHRNSKSFFSAAISINALYLICLLPIHRNQLILMNRIKQNDRIVEIHCIQSMNPPPFPPFNYYRLWWQPNMNSSK